MHKFSAEFDRDWAGWIFAGSIFVSEDTPANAIACFDHGDLPARDTEITRGSQTSGPGSNNQDLRRFCLHHSL
jgi:hypothetical protein